MIGNDIVDLLAANAQSDPMRPRFLNKIFTEKEQEIIFNSKVPDVQIPEDLTRE